MTTIDPTHAALLAGVLATPEDDVPRLVLADWLDEMGGNERAEFIRVQVELAFRVWNCPGCSPHSTYCFEGCDDCDTHSALRRREREYIRDNWLSLLPPGLTPQSVGRAFSCQNLFPDLPGVSFEFRRGFVEAVSCDLATFMGGPCENCGGFGEFRRRHDNGDGPEGPCPDCGGKWNSGPHDDPNDYWDRGTGRTPGIAPRLFASQPVTRVRLTDAELVSETWGQSWLVSHRTRQEIGFPQELEPEIGGNYPTPVAALDALSAALVAYGRANAEGMSHEAVCVCRKWARTSPAERAFPGHPSCTDCGGKGTVRKPGLPPLAIPTEERQR